MRSAEEVETDTEDRPAWETPHEGPTNFFEAVPAWLWMAMGGAFLILLVNVAARVMLPLQPSHRTLLTLLEFSLGFIVAGFAHLSAHLFAACRSDKYGPFDFFMKPIEIWKPSFKQMPEGTKRICGMAWGMTAIFSAILIMAGFAFDTLFDDWGFEKYEAPKAVHEVGKDLTGKAEAIPLETRCVIIGYSKTDKGELDSVILGSAPQGRLAYVGLLSQTDIPLENRAEVLKELQNITPLPECHVKQGVPLKNALWVEPKVLCLVRHKAWTTRFSLQQPSFFRLVVPGEETNPEKKPESDAKNP